ncbi:unnamed protein product [Thelazia callipaeda]|uniref:U3 small nucleolar ribonucleoprotein protein IMP3 n=1 Tax=Thelazia callipaeda TaxID=103827 RepID=A0A0N5CUG9_THECL|nr:unnamed protein product [Thelazia callipaeda]
MDDFIFPEDVDEDNVDSRVSDDDKNESSGINSKLELKSGDDSDNLTVGDCARTMSDSLLEYERVKRCLVEVDHLATQLSYGMRMQAEMDKCALERKNFPLKLTLKRQKLSSGSSLLFIELRNDSQFEFTEWHLALTTSSYQGTSEETKDKIFTKVIPIRRLKPCSEFTYELFSAVELPISLFFRVHLFKCIHLSGSIEPRAFRIALEPVYLTHWNTISKTETLKSSTSRAVLYEKVDEEQKLTLPEALVYLICDEKQGETVLLSWITNMQSDKFSSVNCLVLDDNNSSWPFSVKVKKNALSYDIILRMKNAKLRNVLIQELQMRILKVDFISWELDNNVHEAKILRRYHIKNRQHYSVYNTLAANVSGIDYSSGIIGHDIYHRTLIREIALKLKELPLNDPFRLKTVREFLEKLYAVGLIPTADTLERASKLTASSFCRRRLPVVMKKLEMAETVKNASDLVEQGHVRVGTEMITDPAFLVTRNMQDCVTWTKDSKIRTHILNYNNERDDFLS